MDIQSSPTKLINADYFIGPTFAIKNGRCYSAYPGTIYQELHIQAHI